MKLLDIPIINRMFNYSWGSFANKLLVFFLLPLISHSLAPEEFAVYSIMLLFSSLASHIFQMGLHQSLLTLYHQQPDDESRLTLISTTWRTVTINSIILTVLIVIFRTPLAVILINSSHDFSSLVGLTAFIILFDVFCGLTLVLLNIRQDSKYYAILNLTKNIATLSGVVIFSLAGKLDIFTFFAIITAASLISFLHSIYFFRKIWLEISKNADSFILFSKKIFWEILKFGIFMVPATFAVISLQSADRYMLNLFSARTLYDAGIYSIAYKIGMIMSLFTVVFDLLFFPYIMKFKNKTQVRSQLKHLYTFYCFSATLVAIVIILFSREVFLVLDTSYQEGAGLVFFGVISMHLRGLSNILILGFYILKRSEIIALASILAALINIILNWLWIPDWGIMGAGFASIIAYLFIVIFNFLTVEKAFKSGYNPLLIIISLVIMIFVSLFNFKFSELNYLLFVLKLGFTISLMLIALMIINKNGYIKHIIARIKNEA